MRCFDETIDTAGARRDDVEVVEVGRTERRKKATRDEEDPHDAFDLVKG